MMDARIEAIFEALDDRLDDSLRRAMSRAEHVRLVQIASLIEELKRELDRPGPTSAVPPPPPPPSPYVREVPDFEVLTRDD